MINKLSFLFLFLISIIPLSLITGPAIPDISITFSIFFFLFFIIYNKNFNFYQNNNLILISLIFWLYLLIISLIAENKYLAFRDSIIFIRILFIPIVILYWTNEKDNFLNFILYMIFFAVIFVTIDTFYQYTQYKSELGFRGDLLGFIPNWYGRLTGPFGDELIPGAYLSKFSLLGMIILFIKIKNKFLLNIALVIYLSIIGLVIFGTGERMALATYMMGLCFLLIFFKNKRLIFLISLLSILFLSFIATKLHPFYNDYKIIESTPYHLGLKIEKTYECYDDNNLICSKIINVQPEFTKVLKNFNISAYGEIYYLGVKIFKDHIFFGTGLNNYTYLCNNDDRYNIIMKNYDCAAHPHNIYLQWLIEAGIIGFTIFIIYLTYLFNYSYKSKSEYKLISITTMLILFWPIMSTGSLLKNWNGVSTFFLVGVCLAITNLNKKIN